MLKTINPRLVLFFIIAIMLLVFAVKYPGPQNTWVCEHGNWKKYGQPANRQPLEVCQKN